MKQLNEKNRYDEAVAMLTKLGLTPWKFWAMTRALDIAEALEDEEQFLPGADISDIIESWGGNAEDTQEDELKEAWKELRHEK